MFQHPTILIEKMMRVYIAKINEALDKHVRPIEYKECLDPRSGMVEGMKAILELIKNELN